MSGIIELDHNFGGTAKLGFEVPVTDEGEEEKALLPLPNSYKYKAMVAVIDELKKDSSLDVTFQEGKFSSSARINFRNHVDIKDPKSINKYETELTLRVGSLIQPKLREILISENLNPKDYYRNDSYFESQCQGTELMVVFRRAEENVSN